MDVFILTNEQEGKGNADFIGVYKDATVARKMFNIYIDALEERWRKVDGNIDSMNTFNRFCEPQGCVILAATCADVYIAVRQMTVE